MKRREFIRNGAVVIAAAPFFNFARSAVNGKKMLILGIDGMDPVIVQGMLQQGDLPNLRRLAERGLFTMMRTSIPPQSPVAWGSIISGADPGYFGIFDFIHRRPGDYVPEFSETETRPGGWLINLGKYRIPLKAGDVILKREGKAFWDFLQEQDIEATIVKMPTNYPPSASRQRTLSGLGTPDLLGSYGIYTLYTSDVAESEKELSSANVYYAYVNENNVMEGQIEGPANDLLRESEPMTIPFTVYVDRRHRTVRIDIQQQEILLAEKEYSDWVEIRFSLIPGLQHLYGMVKFYLLELGDKFRLYISPLHVNPRHPAVPICTPAGYSRELSDHIGLFHTISLPADTKALTNGTFSIENHLAQALSVLEESGRLFDFELERFSRQKQGLLFFYFSSLDQGQHVLWALTDPAHPFYHPEESRRFGGARDDLYRRLDREVGKALERSGPATEILVISDHGFAPFRRKVNVNAWLSREGYLRLKTDQLSEETSLLDWADWSQSRAYALGLNGLYLNLSGREGQGIVGAAERRPLLEELKAKLEALRDPVSGEQVISRAYIAADSFTTKFIQRAPDIILGFNRGYRISDSSALGSLAPAVVEDNLSWWSGDHCIDPLHVPASFLSSFKPSRRLPDIRDLAPTILKYFGITPPAEMTGKPLI